MEKQKVALLKLFSIVLRDRSKSEPQYQSISSDMVKFFTRKELIEIITHIHNEDVLTEFNLVEMENEELLLLIKDDYSIISYVTSRWSKEASQLPTQKEWIESKIHGTTEESKETEKEKEISESNQKPKQENAPAKNESTRKGKNA